VQGLLGLTLWYTGTYTYDGSGNVWKMTNGSNIDTFTYDKVSRLREGKIISVAKKQCQSYDAFGNIKGQATVASSQACTPSAWSVDSATNRFLSPVTYDAAGNQTLWNSGLYSYAWYPTGQIRQFDGSNRTTIHGYSTDGERVVTYDSSLAGITYTLRGLDGKVLRQYREAAGVWSWEKDYVYRDGSLLATIDSTGTKHVHLDHLGSIRLITNSSGSQVALHTYLPFGQEATGTTQDSERMKFTGHERDLRDPSNTTDDLDYMHARYYNPNLARFLSPDLLRGDPHQPQSFHLYAYVQNNPITYVDPFGLYWNQEGKWQEDIIVAGGSGDYWAWQHNPLNTLLYGWASYNSGWGGGSLGPGRFGRGPNTTPECMALVPQEPPSVSVNSNIAEAQAHPVDTWNGYRNIYNGMWLVNHVRPGGAWDYKMRYGEGFEDFGNFNYGATFSAAHVSPALALWAAGVVQVLSGNSTMGWTFPAGVGLKSWQLPTVIPPHGDDPGDQALVQRGIAYYKGGCSD